MPPNKGYIPTSKVLDDDTQSVWTDTGVNVTKADDNHHNFLIRPLLIGNSESLIFSYSELE
jgi:hypothetical protein